MSHIPKTDREKALHMLMKATGDAPLVCSGRLTLGTYNEVEIANLAHAYDDGQSVNFTHEVIAAAATRQALEQRAAARMTKAEAEVPGEGAREPEPPR